MLELPEPVACMAKSPKAPVPAASAVPVTDMASVPVVVSHVPVWQILYPATEAAIVENSPGIDSRFLSAGVEPARWTWLYQWPA